MRCRAFFRGAAWIPIWSSLACSPPPVGFDGGTASAFCTSTVARVVRCTPGIPDCQRVDALATCEAAAALGRSTYVQQAAACTTASTACGPAGDLELATCTGRLVRALTATDAERAAVRSMCARCPIDGRATDACVTAEFAAAQSGADAGIVGNYARSVLVLSDQTSQRLAQCVDAFPASADGCVAVSTCLRQVILDPTRVTSTCSASSNAWRCQNPTLATCTDYSGFLTAQREPLRAACVGTFSDGTCPTADRLGGCRTGIGSGTTTVWYYRGDLWTDPSVVATACANTGATFVP